ncbi:MAG: DUF1772 domain-containing protein [Allosphingosinicella sp.]
MLKALLTLVAIALFTGAALYASLVEHPARLRLDDQGARTQWRASSPRAAPMQAGLALFALLLGLWAWWKTGDDWLLAAGLLIGAAIPYTLLVMLPINRRLGDAEMTDLRAQLVRWGQLHLVRVGLGLAALAACLAAFVKP